jgi:hypothetical protein
MGRLIIELTTPGGQPIWLDPNSISKFMPSADHPGGTLLWTFAGTQEVRETPDQILQLLQKCVASVKKAKARMKRR